MFSAGGQSNEKSSLNHAHIEWAAARTEAIATQVQDGNSTPLWQLARMVRARKRYSRVAAAPICDENTCVVTNSDHLVVSWARLIASKSSDHVVSMSTE